MKTPRNQRFSGELVLLVKTSDIQRKGRGAPQSLLLLFAGEVKRRYPWKSAAGVIAAAAAGRHVGPDVGVGFECLLLVQRRLLGSRGGADEEVLHACLQNEDHSPTAPNQKQGTKELCHI